MIFKHGGIGAYVSLLDATTRLKGVALFIVKYFPTFRQHNTPSATTVHWPGSKPNGQS